MNLEISLECTKKSSSWELAIWIEGPPSEQASLLSWSSPHRWHPSWISATTNSSIFSHLVVTCSPNHLRNRIMLEWFALLAICTWAHWLKASRSRGSLKVIFRFRHALLWAARLIIWNANWNHHQQQQAPVPALAPDLHQLNPDHHRSSIGVILHNHRSSSTNCKVRRRKWLMWTSCWMHTTWRCWAPVISGWSWHTGSGVTKRCGNSSSRTSSISTRFCCSISWGLGALTPNTSTSQDTLRYMLMRTICSPSWTRWRLRAASTLATPCLEWLGASPPSSGLPCSRSSSCSPQLPSKFKQPWLNHQFKKILICSFKGQGFVGSTVIFSQILIFGECSTATSDARSVTCCSDSWWCVELSSLRALHERRCCNPLTLSNLALHAEIES